jgi:hypothetical protein
MRECLALELMGTTTFDQNLHLNPARSKFSFQFLHIFPLEFSVHFFLKAVAQHIVPSIRNKTMYYQR